MAVDLKSISRGAAIRAPKIILYGLEGVGKTTWASQAPKPVFLCFEDGMGNLEADRFNSGENDYVLHSYKDALDALASLAEGEHDYQTVVIDSLSSLEPLLWRAMCEDYKVKTIEKVEGGYGKGYAIALDYWKPILDTLDWLRTHKNMAAVVIAHCTLQKFDSPDTDPYHQFSLSVHDKAAAMWSRWCDAQLFARYKTFSDKTEDKAGRTKAKTTGGEARVMDTRWRPACLAKNRFDLPAEMEFSWDAFASAMQNSSTESKKPKPKPSTKKGK